VDELQAFLEEAGATIVDSAGEYYDDYYAVFFLDRDGLKLEGRNMASTTRGKLGSRRWPAPLEPESKGARARQGTLPEQDGCACVELRRGLLLR
jgi:hypothetical protein